MDSPRISGKDDRHEVFKEHHESEGDEEGGKLACPGDLSEEGLIKSDADNQRRGDDKEDGEIGVHLAEAEEPEAPVGGKDNDRSLGNEDNPHGPVDETEPDSCNAIHGTEEDAVNQEL